MTPIWRILLALKILLGSLFLPRTCQSLLLLASSTRIVRDDTSRNLSGSTSNPHILASVGDSPSRDLRPADASTTNHPKKTTKKPRPRIPILRYHSNWVCINKPAGMTVHRDSQSHGTAFVTSTLKRQLRRKVWPVHRLDHRTSGALLLAFDGEWAARLQQALSASRKRYVALVRGDWDQNAVTARQATVTIDQPITHNGVTKKAVTVFHRLAVWRDNTDDNDDNGDTDNDNSNDLLLPHNCCCTLVAAEPRTGRTHQIRRHAAQHLHMPIIGDSQHGDSKVNRWWRGRGIHRLALHCLALDHLPIIMGDDGGEVGENITAPLPDDLKCALESLQPLWEEAVAAEPRLASEWFDERGGTLGIRKEWQQRDDGML